MREIITSNGQLNEEKILKREILYKGLNGRDVERFYVTPTESYIFKPLTNNSQIGKETWVNEKILSSFPPIYPRIIAQSSEQNWIVFEDLGRFTHKFEENTVFQVLEYMAWWHGFPIRNIKDIPRRGQKPLIEEIIRDLIEEKDRMFSLVSTLQLPFRNVEKLYTLIKNYVASEPLVLSHGDLHLGNYTMVNGKVVVLDWEHAHLNSPFWDLYHLFDLSHPMFPKKVTENIRSEGLLYYLEQSQRNGRNYDKRLFIQKYYLFASAFSVWMILLIQNDLSKENTLWPTEKLMAQLSETVTSFIDCSENIL